MLAGPLSCVGWCSHADARIFLKGRNGCIQAISPNRTMCSMLWAIPPETFRINTHFRLHGISDRVRMENENLLRQLGPLVAAMQSGKVKREFVEVLSVDPFLGDYEMPYTGPNKEMFLSIEYLSDAAFHLCREYGIRHPAVIEKVKRADIPGNHGITLRTVHYSRI